MKEAFDGTITKFMAENKPKYSPTAKSWFEKGGSLKIDTVDGKQIWTYTNKAGDSVPYVDGFVEFPDKYLFNGIDKKIDIGEFTGDRTKDMNKLLEVLDTKYGLDEIPAGFVAHHDIENGIFQLVGESIHSQFRHIGGHSLNN